MLNKLFHFRAPKNEPAPAPEPPRSEPPPPPLPPAAENAPAAPRPGSSPMAHMAATGLAMAKPLAEAAKSAATASETAKRSADISLYKNLLAGLYYGIVICDAKGTVIGSNQRAEQYFNYTSQDLWGLQCEELVVGMNARLLYKLRANAEAGRFTVVNGNCKRRDGSTFPAEIAITRCRLLNDGDFIFSIHNVERREKVRDQRDRGEEAVRCAGAGIVVCARDGMIEYVNPAFLKIVHLESEELVLKRLIGDFLDSIELLDAMLHAPSAQGAWMGCMNFKNAKGLACEVLVTSALSQSRHGGESRLVLTLTPLPKKIG